MPPAKLSPLMEQYYQNKKLYPDALLLFRVGDFYETFADDAITVARDLNITLTSRQKDGQGEKIPLAGVPYHALDAYLARLIRAGHKVAICDQVEDPKQARGLVKRAITRVVTPGTIIEPSMLEEGSNNFLAAVAKEEDRAGLAFVDVSTGEFLTTEVPSHRLTTELARFRPAECLSAAPLHWEEAREQILDEESFSLERAAFALADRYGPDWKERLRLEGRELSQRACGAVLSYLIASRFDLLDHLKDIQIYSGSDYMVLDEVTVRNLEISRNIRDRSRRGTLLEFLDRTRTAMGARTLARWIQMPLQSEEAIGHRLEGVEELASRSLLQRSLAEELKGASDLERLLGRISCKSASPKDLFALKGTLERLPRLQAILGDAGSPYLQDILARLSPLDDTVSLIERSIISDPPLLLRDGGVIREGYNAELDQFREILRDGRGWISRLEGAERERTGIRSLKIAFNNVFGYYIEVSRANLHLVPQDYIRKQTLANGERFVTPELKEMESRVLSAQERSVSLEQELFARVRDEVAGRAGAIQGRAMALAELDVLLSLAEVAQENDLVRPEFNQEGRISLRSSRHPVLARTMRGGFVPNDILLDQGSNRLIILTGPNMAGKSTFMRQIALAAIMAQSGSFVPAAHASLCLVDRIFTRVGAYDDLSAGQSTFMVEMTEIAHILTSATKRSLVLLDEVGRGTSTFDGLSLAWAITEYLHESIKCKSVFATHYHQLTELESILPGVRNYSIAVKEDKGTITFLRTVVPGATDRSYGVHVARLAGVPRMVTRRADEILRDLEKEAVVLPGSGRGRQRRAARYTQLIFFDGDDGERAAGEKESERPDPIIEEIMSLDLDRMTPREALDRLAQYQQMQRERTDR